MQFKARKGSFSPATGGEGSVLGSAKRRLSSSKDSGIKFKYTTKGPLRISSANAGTGEMSAGNNDEDIYFSLPAPVAKHVNIGQLVRVAGNQV